MKKSTARVNYAGAIYGHTGVHKTGGLRTIHWSVLYTAVDTKCSYLAAASNLICDAQVLLTVPVVRHLARCCIYYYTAQS